MKNELLQDLENHFETLNHIRNLAQNYDERLLDYLLEQSIYKDEFKTRFFITTKNALIFKLNDFLTFLDLRNLSGSFTSYANKIGLSFKTKGFLKTNNEVVLNFAFKDGVIKGSQSKDDEKSKEIFFNEILAKDEIDILFAKKALHSFELIGKGDLKENLKNANLLIKGNNLLALHSLKKKFANKVKLIYIDPPYNPNSAANTFSYNNSFNHSTWLTFMKNRLEIAKEFLRDDGFFCIAIDHNELFYLGVLCDEIFGRENRVCVVSVETNPGGRSDSKFLATSNEFFIAYTKNIQLAKINDLPLNKKMLDQYKLQDDISLYKLVPLKRTGSNSTPDKRPNLCFPIYYDKHNCSIALSKQDGLIEIWPIGNDGIMHVWRWSKDKILNSLDDIEIKNNNGKISINVKDRIKYTKKAKTLWYDAKYDASSYGTKYLQKFSLQETFSYPKPIGLMEDILQLFTNKGDLVLDYHVGSGTTLEVAHKMNRRYIGIEQMDYIETITKERLKKVIEGEQGGGISENVEWSGGGSFVYAELMPLNALYKEKIQNSNNEKELESMYKDLESKAFLDYRVDLQNILKDKEFRELDLENKKEVLKLILDSNMDYVLYGDIQDKDYAISKETIELNKIFYGDENV